MVVFLSENNKHINRHLQTYTQILPLKTNVVWSKHLVKTCEHSG